MTAVASQVAALVLQSMAFNALEAPVGLAMEDMIQWDFVEFYQPEYIYTYIYVSGERNIPLNKQPYSQKHLLDLTKSAWK